MRILIGADLVPMDSNIKLFATGNANELVGHELLQLLNNSENYNVFNLEIPLSDTAAPIAKCGPNLIAPTNTIAGYTALCVDLLTLANNHILDQDQQGLESTLNVLEQNHINYLGVGESLIKAAEPVVIDFASKKVGFYACAEHEFSIVTKGKSGANPFDPLETPDHIAKLKKQCDFVIVLYHGGKEHYRYPSPNLQKICRKLVDKGAGLVVCQHSHCIGCEEKYKDGTIVYGQGNFLFDHSESEYWQTSLLLSLDEEMNVTYLPLIKHGNGVRLAKGEKSKQILNDFRRRSEEITQDGFVEKKYKEFAATMVNNYLFTFSGVRKTFIYKVFDKLSGYRLTSAIMNRKYKLEQKLVLRNSIECEAHRELLLRGVMDENE